MAWKRYLSLEDKMTVGCGCTAFLVNAAFWIAVIYLVVHFAHKYW